VPVNSSPQTQPTEPSGDRCFCRRLVSAVVNVVYAGIIVLVLLIVLSLIGSLLVTPWVSLLDGGLSEHDDYYWAVNPAAWSLAWRGGVCAAAMLALIFNPSGWIQRTRATFEQGPRSRESAESSGNTDGRARAETHAETANEETRDGPGGQAPADTQADRGNLSSAMILALMTGSFLVLLIALIGIFAGTDMQAAHDHLHGAMQCFSVGIPHPDGSVDGQLHAWDALYFTTGNMTTAGTGSIAPLSTSCRALTTVQTGIGTTVILLGIGGLLTRLLQSPLIAGGQRSQRE
jgi:hypothetical protein